MGLLGKLLPWKRKDDLALNDNMGFGGFGQPGMQGQGMPRQDLGLGGLGGNPYDQLGGGGGMGGIPSSPLPYGQPSFPGGRPSMEAFQQNQAYERSYAAGKEIEVVSAKLDAIKSALEALNQRLASIERFIQTEQDFKKRGGGW